VFAASARNIETEVPGGDEGEPGGGGGGGGEGAYSLGLNAISNFVNTGAFNQRSDAGPVRPVK
jgi:hypothetical protein